MSNDRLKFWQPSIRSFHNSQTMLEGDIDKTERAPSLTVVRLNFVFWALSTSYSINQRLFGGFRSKAFNRGYSDFVYKGMTSTFVVAAAFAYLGFIGTKSVLKRAMISIFITTLLVVAASWFLLYLRAGLTFVDVAGHPLDTIRHIQWLHDRSNILYILSLLSKADNASLTRAMAGSVVCWVFGFLGGLARRPFDEVFVALSWMGCLYMCHEVFDMFQKAIDGDVPNNIDVWTLRSARNIALFSFNFIGTAWWLAKNNIVSFAAGEAGIAFGEFMIKIVLMLVIVNNSVEESQLDSLTKMDTITSILDEQMAASDRLLEKMIPAGVLDQIKSGKVAGAEEFASVTVFFSDICNFTPLSQRTSTKDMLASLNKMWVEYDAISKVHSMYKVETIGDAFLGVIGAPDRVPDHAERACAFALDILDMIKGFRLVTGEPIEIRAGLHSGPVTAGILGETNPHWCVVGDTVVIASKMEQTSKHMKAHISENTYKLIKGSGKFTTSPGESLSLKAGIINTFFLEGRS
ncbi:nucleotide cyclase [Chytriomyces sp. MP71]|nr:nucleotide cyclase [Chytriomyces sp. MP71]